MANASKIKFQSEGITTLAWYNNIAGAQILLLGEFHTNDASSKELEQYIIDITQKKVKNRNICVDFYLETGHNWKKVISDRDYSKAATKIQKIVKNKFKKQKASGGLLVEARTFKRLMNYPYIRYQNIDLRAALIQGRNKKKLTMTKPMLEHVVDEPTYATVGGYVKNYWLHFNNPDMGERLQEDGYYKPGWWEDYLLNEGIELRPFNNREVFSLFTGEKYILKKSDRKFKDLLKDYKLLTKHDVNKRLLTPQQIKNLRMRVFKRKKKFLKTHPNITLTTLQSKVKKWYNSNVEYDTLVQVMDIYAFYRMFSDFKKRIVKNKQNLNKPKCGLKQERIIYLAGAAHTVNMMNLISKVFNTKPNKCYGMCKYKNITKLYKEAKRFDKIETALKWIKKKEVKLPNNTYFF